MRGFLRIYHKLLEKHPYGMQAVQTAILMATGDQLAQNLVEQRKLENLDFKRTANFAVIGLFCGPALRTCYGVLDKTFGSQGKLTALKKVACDQAIFAPCFILFLVSAIAASQGKDISGIKTKIEDEYLDILKNNYKLWPMVQLANFSLVPLQYQVLFVQMFALVWNTYISYRTNQAEEERSL